MTNRQIEHVLLDIITPAAILIAIITIAVLVLSVRPASAHCPPGTAYGCVRDFDGKQVCGCR